MSDLHAEKATFLVTTPADGGADLASLPSSFQPASHFIPICSAASTLMVAIALSASRCFSLSFTFPFDSGVSGTTAISATLWNRYGLMTILRELKLETGIKRKHL